MCVCLYTRKIKGRYGCVYVCVCVCHYHSPVNSFLYVYVCTCMLTSLNDCDYIRQYLTVNCEVLCIKNDVVFPYNYTMQPFQQPHAKKKMSSAFTWYANYHPTVNNKWGVSKNITFGCWSNLYKSNKNENNVTLICKKR